MEGIQLGLICEFKEKFSLHPSLGRDTKWLTKSKEKLSDEPWRNNTQESARIKHLSAAGYESRSGTLDWTLVVEHCYDSAPTGFLKGDMMCPPD